jgi:hypothetical protein
LSGLGHRAGFARGAETEVGKGGSVGVQEAQDVMVGPHQELDRAWVRPVLGQDGGVDVTMGRYQRELGHLPVKVESQLSQRRLGGQQPVGVREHRVRANGHPQTVPHPSPVASRRDETGYSSGPG